MTDQLPLVEGAPAQTGQPEPQPEFVPFVVDGQTYQLDARLAARLAQDTNTPPAQPQAFQPQPQPQPQQSAQYAPPAPQTQPELHDLMFRDPATFIRLFRDDIRSEIINEYRQEQVRNSFWQNLYETDNSLRAVPRNFIDGVIMENTRLLQGLPDQAAITQVARLVKEKIASFSGIGQNAQAPLPAAYADGGSPVSPQTRQQLGGQTAQAQQEEEPQTLSQLIRQRQAARRQGMSTQS